ncbi:hypothetical protein D3C78_1075440 [compost metagenome]
MVAAGIGRGAGLVVEGGDHHAVARGENRRAFRHGDVHRIAALGREMAVLAIGALALAVRPAAPGQRIAVWLGQQARIAEGVAELGRVAQRLGWIARCQGQQADLAARRQDPAQRPVRHARGVGDILQAQLDLHRREHLVVHPQGFAAGMLVGIQMHPVVQRIVEHRQRALRATAGRGELEHPRARAGLVAVGDHAIGVDVLVDGQRADRSGQAEQEGQQEQTGRHDGTLSADRDRASLQAAARRGESRRRGL